MNGFPCDEIQRVLDAGHPDDAMVALPISLLREIARVLPVEAIVAGGPAKASA